MIQTKYYLFTGATSGLGIEAAAQLAKADKNSVVIAGVRNPEKVDALRSAIPSAQLIVLKLDTSALTSVKLFADEVRRVLAGARLSGIALNAGVQIVSGTRYSEDGFELTFATNVLGHIVLFQYLEDVLHPSAIIVSTASGTHDKDHKLARPYKFYGGYFPSADDVAAGNVSSSTDSAQLGRDRYATSKLCNILFTYAMARKYAKAGPRSIAFDPGLMPGTELARDQPAALRFAWKNILPAAARMIDGASTTKRSGEILSRLLLATLVPSGNSIRGNGVHIEFTGKEIQSSKLSYDEKIQDALIEWVSRRKLL